MNVEKMKELLGRIRKRLQHQFRDDELWDAIEQLEKGIETPLDLETLKQLVGESAWQTVETTLAPLPRVRMKKHARRLTEEEKKKRAEYSREYKNRWMRRYRAKKRKAKK